VKAIELAAEPRRHYNNTIRGWSELPVSVVPA
jgi:hypothetical protein